MLLWAIPFFGQLSLDDSDQIIHQLVDGNYGRKCELSVLELFELEPDFFDALSQEVFSIFRRVDPTAKKLTLLNKTGRFRDTSSDHDGSARGKWFFHRNQYPHLARLISLFPHAINFRMTRMGPLSRLYHHNENICLRHKETGEPCLRVRFHLPIKTNPMALMFMDREYFQFESGSIYFFHNGRIHDALNNHPEEDRIHLIWDMLLTEDTFHRMFERSIPLPGCIKVEAPFMNPVGFGDIDPDPLDRPRIYEYDEALHATLCPLQ